MPCTCCTFGPAISISDDPYISWLSEICFHLRHGFCRLSRYIRRYYSKVFFKPHNTPIRTRALLSASVFISALVAHSNLHLLWRSLDAIYGSVDRKRTYCCLLLSLTTAQIWGVLTLLFTSISHWLHNYYYCIFPLVTASGFPPKNRLRVYVGKTENHRGTTFSRKLRGNNEIVPWWFEVWHT